MTRRKAVGVGGSGRPLDLQFTIEGVDKTQDEFKAVRREINGSLRDVMVRVGESEILPTLRSRFPGSRFAASLYAKRDRAGVFIGSRMRGNLNRAVGWLDFGGKRPHDTIRRVGPYTMVNTLRAAEPRLETAIERELLHEFGRRGFDIERA